MWKYLLPFRGITCLETLLGVILIIVVIWFIFLSIISSSTFCFYGNGSFHFHLYTIFFFLSYDYWKDCQHTKYAALPLELFIQQKNCWSDGSNFSNILHPFYFSNNVFQDDLVFAPSALLEPVVFSLVLDSSIDFHNFTGNKKRANCLWRCLFMAISLVIWLERNPRIFFFPFW